MFKNKKNNKKNKGISLIELLIVMGLISSLLYLLLPEVEEVYNAFMEREKVNAALLVARGVESYMHIYGDPATGGEKIPTLSDLIEKGFVPDSITLANYDFQVVRGAGGNACLWTPVKVTVTVSYPWFQGLVPQYSYDAGTHTYTVSRTFLLAQSHSDYRAKARGECQFAWW